MGIRDRIEPFTSGAQDAERFRRNPLGKLRGWAFSFALMIGAIVIIAATQHGDDADVENLWAAVAFVLFVTGATARVWRKVREAEFEALRWRRLHRRIFWRAAVVSLLAGLISLWFVAFWQWRSDKAFNTIDVLAFSSDSGHAAFFRGLSAWLCAAAVPIVAIEPFAWLLWPRPIRSAVRRGRVAKMLTTGRRFGTQLDLDPNLGAAGRPRAANSESAREPSVEAHRITPHGVRPLHPDAATNAWWSNAAIAWDGHDLTLTDGKGRTRAFPVVRSASTQQEGRQRPVAELVRFKEVLPPRYSTYSAASSARKWRLGPRRRVERVLLLDANGRRVAQLPAAGFEVRDLAAIARAAGLPFAAYDLGSVGFEGRAANPLLFPGRWRAVKISGPRDQRVQTA